LNNEGGEGNQIITRQVTIVDKNGITHTVNAISGDMFKHIHAVHQANYCVEHNLPLSSLAKLLSPDRISADELNAHITVAEKSAKQKDVQDGFIQLCTITDTHGVLMTDAVKGIKNTPRKSVIEFGWTVGIPQKSNSDTYFHMRGATESSPNPTPFNRPANYGVYAFVCSVEVYRIGFNDIKRGYSIDDPARESRYKSVVVSLLNSFINPQGAMTSTQKPHITDLKGVVSISSKLIPAPTISAINEEYQTQIEKIVTNLNKIEPDAIELKEFDGLGKLSEILAELINYEPYKIA
jgi:CRISPR-associated protein Cst2